MPPAAGFRRGCLESRRVGAFLYARKTPGMDLEGIRRRYRRALGSLDAKRLARGPVVDGEGFALFLFHKRLLRAEQLVMLPGGDFIAAVGTLFYRGKCGAAALRLLYEDFGGAADLFSQLYGSYAVILRKHGTVSWFNDYFGTYHVYGDEQGDVVSSSFLAVLATLPQLRVCEQALYEYVFDAASYGDETPVRGVRRLDAAQIHELHPRRRAASKRHACSPAELPASFDQQVDAANAELVAYFRTLRAGVGDRMLLGLSGGYDSRLLLAAALKAGAAPALFVGGPAGSQDVRLAQAVAARAGLPLAHLDTASLPRSPPAQFAAGAREKLAYYDGVGIRGAVNDGEEYLWRCQRLRGPLLELNGGGGEIYRDFWKLPDRRIALLEFVAGVLEFKNLDKFAAASARFSRERYRESLVHKLKRALRTGADSMSRAELASLYTRLRSAAFAGPSNKELNLLAHGLLPFAEPRLALPSYAVPLRHKVYGRFEAHMIRRLSPALAELPSSYGHPFSVEPPLKKRLRESLERHCRSVLPLPLLFAAYRRLRKQNQYNSAPCYYADEYLGQLLDLKRLRMAEYFDIARVRALDDPYVFSRLLSMELLLVERHDAALDGEAHQPRDVADAELFH
jgi:hypothetical protein